ncbi:MAG: hypothetical protein KDD53_12460, partial [Bdellovibrionales bacterium]|nr:hypothetical protein [Bdellovibrionales bacterium]
KHSTGHNIIYQKPSCPWKKKAELCSPTKRGYNTPSKRLVEKEMDPIVERPFFPEPDFNFQVTPEFTREALAEVLEHLGCRDVIPEELFELTRLGLCQRIEAQNSNRFPSETTARMILQAKSLPLLAYFMDDEITALLNLASSELSKALVQVIDSVLGYGNEGEKFDEQGLGVLISPKMWDISDIQSQVVGAIQRMSFDDFGILSEPNFKLLLLARMGLVIHFRLKALIRETGEDGLARELYYHHG